MTEPAQGGVPKELIDAAMISGISDMITAVHPKFDGAAFRDQAGTGLDALALRARSAQIADALATTLPGTFAEASEVLLGAMGTADEDGDTYGSNGMAPMPMLDFVERHGLDDPETALPVLSDMTQHFSAEFAIRPYLKQYPEMTWSWIENWSKDADWRRRRLASEGTRPRLPWGSRLHQFIADPTPLVALLNSMHSDPNEVVRRSVANNLNDISKDHPDLAAETAQDWAATDDEGSRWTARHAMRSLIKQGHPRALELNGFTGGDAVALSGLQASNKRPRVGERLTFDFVLASDEPDTTRLAIDYALDRTLANGRQARKVFKLAVCDLATGASRSFSKVHDFTQRSTRTYYPGPHAITIIVNGREKGSIAFDLTK